MLKNMGNTITIRRWDNDKVIFSHTCENNTMGKTVKEAIKQGISLSYANLKHSILNELDISRINLQNADLSCAELLNVDLSYADLTCAILYNADISYSNLSYADLTDCFMASCNLKYVNLNYANLYRAILNNADLCGINAVDVKGINDQCPKTGSFIGWKKCVDIHNKEYIVKLEIPADAKRSSATTNKCRCSKAKVLEIQNFDGSITNIDNVHSVANYTFKYKVNEYVYPNSFDDRFWVECSNGIHFFMNREDAVNYIY